MVRWWQHPGLHEEKYILICPCVRFSAILWKENILQIYCLAFSSRDNNTLNVGDLNLVIFQLLFDDTLERKTQKNKVKKQQQLYMCTVYTYIHTHTCFYTNVCVCVYIYVNVRIYTNIYVYAYMQLKSILNEFEWVIRNQLRFRLTSLCPPG